MEFREKPASAYLHYSHNERIRLLLESLGPTFIKFGQLLSTRADIVSADLIRELSKLQDGVPPFSGEEAIDIVEQEFGKKITTIFYSFNTIPLASASIAQVHEAQIHNGKKVAVKIQRPHIENIITLDILILKDIARFAEHNIKILAQFQPLALINKFSDSLMKELDFQHEMENLKRFNDTYKDTAHLRILSYYEELSSKRVFTMEFIGGKKIASLWESSEKNTDGISPSSDKSDKNKMGNHKSFQERISQMREQQEKQRVNKLIADRFISIALEQIFEVGYFHGDPHPGNVKIMDDGCICFLDFGVMGYLGSQQKEHMTDMIIAIPSRNLQRFTRALLALMGVSNMHNFEGLMQECGTLLDTYLDGSLQDIELGKLIQDLVNLIVAYKFSVPPTITLMSKSLTAIEGIALNLDPRINILDKLTPFIKKLTQKRFMPKQLFKRSLSTAIAYSELYENIPEYAQELYNIVKSGNTRVQLDILHLNESMSIIDTIAYRLVFGLVLAALIISSSIIMYAKIPPLWNNISFIGIAGFLVSGIMGFGFIIAVLVKLIKNRHTHG